MQGKSKAGGEWNAGRERFHIVWEKPCAGENPGAEKCIEREERYDGGKCKLVSRIAG